MLLRYALYGANARLRVPLGREAKYLERYVAPQRLRLDEHVRISWAKTGDFGGLPLEPVLLMPFAENAFKCDIRCRHPCRSTSSWPWTPAARCGIDEQTRG